MRKRVVSLFMALVLCVSLVPTAAWATTENDADSNAESAGQRVTEAKPNADAPPAGPDDSAPAPAGEGGGLPNGGGDGENAESSDSNPSNDVPSTGTVQDPPANSAAPATQEADIPTPLANEDPSAEAVAKIGETSYPTLQEALNAAKDGDTITLQQDIAAGENEAFVFDGSKTVTLDMNGHSIIGQYNTYGGAFLSIKSGTLRIKTIDGGVITIGQKTHMLSTTILVSGGTLEFQNKVKITGGLKVTGDGQLTGSLKEGSIFLYNDYNSVRTISVEKSNIYNQIVALLEDGYAYAKCDENGTPTTPLALRSGASASESISVAVVSHPACSFATGVCACGRPCPHTRTNGDGSCVDCGTKPEAKIGSSDYHWTLQAALDAVQDGDTVTLLKEQSGVSCTYNKTGAITIDLNGNTWSNASGTPLTISSGHVTLENGTVLGGSGSNQRGIFVEKDAALTLGRNTVVRGIFLNHGITSRLLLSKGSVVLGRLYLSPPAKPPASYLPAGTALVRCSYDEGTGTVTYTKNEDGSYQFITAAYPTALEFNENMAVVAHTHSFVNGTCACGLTAAAGVGDAIYPTVADAVAAAGGKTVKLLAGSAGLGESLTVSDGEALTIDLNGNTLSAAVTVLGTLTLTNSADVDGTASDITLGDGTTDGALQIPDGKVRIDSLTVANKTPTPLPQQGRYHAISCTGGLTLGDLLPQPDANGTRYAFNHAWGVSTYFKRSDHGFSIASTGSYATITPCTVHGAWDNGLCGYCGYACPHSSTGIDGKCTTCGGQFAALLNTNTGTAAKSYATLSGAVAAANAAPGSTLQLVQDSDNEQTFISTGTWTLDMHGKTLPNTSFTVESGTLAVQNLYTGSVGKLNSVTVKDGGKLEVPAYTGGCIAGIDTVTVEEGGSAALGYGDTVYGSITNNNPNGTLHDLLGDGCAFADADGNLIDGYTASTAANVKVAAHPNHTIGADYTCPCGFSCHHPGGFPSGKCSICGTLCPHTDLTGSGDTYTCNTCGQTMAVRVTKGGTTTYYAKIFDSTNTENTLRTVFNAVENGSAVTLLEGGLRTFSFVKDDKTLTLNLNGKPLVETYDNGIAVDSGSTLIVTGQGSSEVLTDQNGRPSFVFNIRGGTLELDSGFSGSFGRIRIGSGTLTFNGSATVKYLDIDHSDVHITLNSGTFGCIAGRDTFTGSMAANSLLPKGYAFRKADGSYVAYGTELTKGTLLENVTVVKCPHPSINNHGGSTDRWCDSCNTQIAAELKTAAGAFIYYEDFDTALDAAQKSAGCTLTVYEDDCKLNITGGNFTLDLNGHSPDRVWYDNGLHYALCVQKGAAVTVKDLHVAGDYHDWSSKGYTGSVYVSDGASLTLVGCEVQDLRAAFTGSDTPSTVTLDGTWVHGALNVYHCNLTVVDGRMENKLTASDGSTVEIRGGMFVGAVDAYGANSLKLSGGSFVSITAPKWKTITDCLAEGYVLWEGNSVIDSTVSSVTYKQDLMYIAPPPFKNVQAANPTVTTTYGQSVTLNAGIDCGGSTREFTLTWYCDDAQGGSVDIASVPTNPYPLTVMPASAGEHTYRLVFAEAGYSEECTFTVTVEPAALTDVSVRQTNELTYTGQPLTATVATSAAAVNRQTVTFTYCAAQDGTYSDAVPAFTAAGEHTVYYKASAPNHAEYTGSFKVSIAPKTVTATVEVAGGSTYNGQPQRPTVTVRDGDTTIDPSEYTVVYTNNINAGTATVTIEDKEGGNYAVSGSAVFSIARKDITGATITLGEPLIYNATPQTQTVASVVTADGIPVTTYDVVSDVGTTPGGSPFDLTVRGTGNFTGSASTTFTVAPAPLTIKALDKTIYVGDEAPDLTAPVLGEHYTVEGLMGNDTLAGLMEGVTLQYVDADGTPVEPDTSKAGKVRILLHSGELLPDSGNYDITYAEGTLTIATRSSSYYYTKPTSPDAEQSPRTGDAGLLVYGLTALGSYTGTALVLRRRKRED